MKTNETAALVQRGHELHRRITLDQAELKKINAALEAIGLANPDQHVALVNEDRQGTRWIADGRLPVVFESDQLINSFTAGAACEATIRHSLEGTAANLADFYRTKTTLEMIPRSGLAFRKCAAELLGPLSPQFIAACTARDSKGIKKSRTVIQWDEIAEG